MSTCFVIMPVTTPDHFQSTYNNDRNHFPHVLEHLFRPALESLAFEIIPPTAAGADLIHAEIIRNLETSDLVLCDMSILNPNVFFELGIRTALNKPVCMVKDDTTPAIPFDTGIINFHTYLSELAPWTLASEVQQLKEHISSSVERSDGKNALWSYFGLATVALPPAQEAGADAKLDLLLLQFEALNRRLERPAPLFSLGSRPPDRGRRAFWTLVSDTIAKEGMPPAQIVWDEEGNAEISLEMTDFDEGIAHRLFNLAEGYGIGLTLKPRGL